MNVNQLPIVIKRKMETAKLPVIYEDACRGLAECRTLDEAMYYADKADALAAWAKIYKNDVAGVEAKRLKLHAYRRMSDLAEEVSPIDLTKNRGKGSGRTGGKPGPHKLLIAQGFSKGQAQVIRRVGATPEKQFQRLVREGAGTNRASQFGRGFSPLSRTFLSQAWVTATRDTNSLLHMRRWMRKHDAKELGRGIWPDEVLAAKALIVEIQEWLDEFEQHLPKEKK